MGIVHADEIAGYNFKGEIVHQECATVEEEKNVEGDEIITNDEIQDEETLYFCDRCKKRIL
ncbi:MAG: hypothetical protein ABSC55_21935 [Syntrophorhabdales bacterium]|jgi:hypothetical protein